MNKLDFKHLLKFEETGLLFKLTVWANEHLVWEKGMKAITCVYWPVKFRNISMPSTYAPCFNY